MCDHFVEFAEGIPLAYSSSWQQKIAVRRTIELVRNKNDQRPPLADYRPLKTGWQRDSELSEPEVEQRGKIGLVLILLVILLLVLLFGFPAVNSIGRAGAASAFD